MRRIFQTFTLLIISLQTVLCQKNLRHSPTIIQKQENKRPIIFTFFELKSNVHGELVDKNPSNHLLSVWSDLWTEAGWEPRILTLEDAKKHPDYEKYSKAIVTEGNLFEGGFDYMCFMRWLAMAAHGNGGWMSDNDVFPMGITVEQGINLPNEGQFTSFEMHVPSLLSGSGDEWMRMSKYILEVGIDKAASADFYSDMDAILNDPHSHVEQSRVWKGFPYSSKNIMDCEIIKGYLAAHVSPRRTHMAIEDGLVTYRGGENTSKFIEVLRPDLARELNRNWKEQCSGSSQATLDRSYLRIQKQENKRPIIYTFFELKLNHKGNLVDDNPFNHLLSVWSDLWTEAGWEPRILTLEDAKKHPDYEKYSNAIATKGNLFEGGYDYMCFMRWLAMAAHGNGGWMSDNDVFPMGITVEQGINLPNKGQFTSFEMQVPSLLSGSGDEWMRMSKYILEVGIEKAVHEDFYSDMFALRDIQRGDPQAHIKESKVWKGFPYSSKNVMDCEVIKGYLAAHISHSRAHRAIEDGLVTFTGGENILKFIEASRPDLARELDRNRKEQCLII